MQDIKTTENESDSNQHIHDPERRVCTVCTKQTSKYTCPKCATPYCSLECYRNHSSKCVDTFHKESVDDFLKHQRVTEEEKLKMQRILKRAEEQSKQEEDTFDRMKNETEEWTEEDEFFERLAETETDLNELKLEHLPKAVQDRFLRDLAAGKIKVESWVPWWQHISTIDASDSINKVKIEIISPEPEEEQTKDPPPEVTQIPSLTTLISKPPSPLLAFNIVNVLFSYAFSARVFNGELSEDALQYMSQVSEALSGTSVYQNVKLALQAAIENSLKPGIAVTTQFSVSVVRDVASILSTKKAVLAALSDMWRLVDQVKTEQKKKRQLELIQKKLNFLLAWVNEQDDILFSNLQLTVLDDYLERKTQLSTK